MKKGKVIAAVTAVLLAAGTLLPTTTAFAASTKKLAVEEQKYKSGGIIEVELAKKVDRNSKLSVSVTDSSGKKYTATLSDHDGDDDLKVKIKNYKAGKTYSYKISGIRNGSTTYYAKGTVKIPASSSSKYQPKIEKTEYDGNGLVEVDFNRNIKKYSKTKVTVTDSTGKKYTATLKDNDGDDDLKFQIKNYKAGKTYTYKFTNLRTSGSNNYSASGKVKIPSDSKYKPTIQKAEYEGNGLVEVDFNRNIQQYSKTKVTVTDSSGKKYTATLKDNDGDDDLKFQIKNYKAGKTYTYKFTNLRTSGSTNYSVSGTVKIPLHDVTLEKVEYDGNGKVEVNFLFDVQFRHDVSVTAKDSTGKSYKTRIFDRDDDELDFSIQNYKKGEKYTFTIKGVRAEGTSTYKNISGKVSIPADTGYITEPEAKQIALKKAGLTASQITRYSCDFDREDNVYEIEFYKKNSRLEYSFEIKATNGRIIEWDAEYDD